MVRARPFNRSKEQWEGAIPDTSSTLAGLPPEQTGPAAWYGPAMEKRKDWIVELDDYDIEEIDTALAPLVEREADIAQIRQADFPLPRLNLITNLAPWPLAPGSLAVSPNSGCKGRSRPGST